MKIELKADIYTKGVDYGPFHKKGHKVASKDEVFEVDNKEYHKYDVVYNLKTFPPMFISLGNNQLGKVKELKEQIREEK